ncbi:MAG: hypothetical protein BRC31_02855, partial [Actinobacteria bacterium QS_5_72_10]
ARLVDAEAAAVDYVSGEEGLLMAPVYAVPRLLDRNGLSLADFDVVEIHEAFASTVLATLAAWQDAAYCKERLGRDGPLGTVDRERLKTIVDFSSAFIGYATLDGNMVFLNNAGQRMVGLDDTDDVHRTALRDFFAPGDHDYLDDHILPTVREEERWLGEFRLQHFQTGETVPVYLDLFTIPDPDTASVRCASGSTLALYPALRAAALAASNRSDDGSLGSSS